MNAAQIEHSPFLHNAVNHFQSGMQELKLVINNLGISSKKAPLRHNFMKYGVHFGAINFSDYENIARLFGERARASNSSDYSIIELPGGRVGVDFRGEVRGIYLRDGTPLAFFKPDYKQLGYSSKERELSDWRSGKSMFYA